MFKEAKWVWYEGVSSKNSFGEFYGEFCAEKKAMAKISCDGDYTLFINGKYATSGQYGDFPHYKVYDEFDITKYCKNGTNVVAVTVWYYGKTTLCYYPGAHALRYEIWKNGELTCFSSENTLCRQSKDEQSFSSYLYVSRRCSIDSRW